MMDEAVLTLAQLGVIAGLGALGAILWRRDFRLAWFIGALALYGLYNFLLTRGFFLLPNWPAGAGWNWLGKLLAMTSMLALAALPVLGWQRSGLRWKQDKGSSAAIAVLAVLCALIFYFAITGADGRDDWETIAFQWTMPGFDEELFYRGVLLLAMNEAFRSRIPVLGASIGYGGLLTSVLFGLAHAMSFQAGALGFDPSFFLMTALPSLLLVWMRERTGSIVLPIIAHNVINGAFTLF